MLLTYDQAVREAVYLGRMTFADATESDELWLDLVTPALLRRAVASPQGPMEFGDPETGRVDAPHVHALCAGFLRGWCQHIGKGDKATTMCPDGLHYCPKHGGSSTFRSNCQRCYDLGMLPNQLHQGGEQQQARESRETFVGREIPPQGTSYRPSPPRNGPQGRGGRGGGSNDGGGSSRGTFCGGGGGKRGRRWAPHPPTPPPTQLNSCSRKLQPLLPPASPPVVCTATAPADGADDLLTEQAPPTTQELSDAQPRPDEPPPQLAHAAPHTAAAEGREGGGVREVPLSAPAQRCAVRREAPCPSPLAEKLGTWESELRKTHAHFCKDPRCTGLRPLQTIVATDEYLPPDPMIVACLQAVEAESILHLIYHGVPVLPAGITPEQIPAFSVPNYPCPPHVATEIRRQIDAELAQGAIYELSDPPRQCTAIFYKEEDDGQKIRMTPRLQCPKRHCDQRPAHTSTLPDDGHARRIRMYVAWLLHGDGGHQSCLPYGSSETRAPECVGFLLAGSGYGRSALLCGQETAVRLEWLPRGLLPIIPGSQSDARC